MLEGGGDGGGGGGRGRRRREGPSARCTLAHKRCPGLPSARSRRGVPLLLLAAPHCSLRTPGSPGRLLRGPTAGLD